METDTLMSIIAIIVGIIIMAFPYFGVAATSVIFGLGFIIWGVITLLYSYMLERITGPFAASGIIIGILMIIFGAALIFSPHIHFRFTRQNWKNFRYCRSDNRYYISYFGIYYKQSFRLWIPDRSWNSYYGNSRHIKQIIVF